jgi:hypothetical protein
MSKPVDNQYQDALNIAQGQLCLLYQQGHGRALEGPLDWPDIEALHYLMHEIGQSELWLCEVKCWLGLMNRRE